MSADLLVVRAQASLLFSDSVYSFHHIVSSLFPSGAILFLKKNISAYL